MRNPDKTKGGLQNDLVELQKAYDKLKRSPDRGNALNNKSRSQLDQSESKLKDALDDLTGLISM